MTIIMSFILFDNFKSFWVFISNFIFTFPTIIKKSTRHWDSSPASQTNCSYSRNWTMTTSIAGINNSLRSVFTNLWLYILPKFVQINILEDFVIAFNIDIHQIMRIEVLFDSFFVRQLSLSTSNA